jgi:hypothetical protein
MWNILLVVVRVPLSGEHLKVCKFLSCQTRNRVMLKWKDLPSHPRSIYFEFMSGYWLFLLIIPCCARIFFGSFPGFITQDPSAPLHALFLSFFTAVFISRNNVKYTAKFVIDVFIIIKLVGNWLSIKLPYDLSFSNNILHHRVSKYLEDVCGIALGHGMDD